MPILSNDSGGVYAPVLLLCDSACEQASPLVQVGFQKDSKWLYTGSEDGTIKIFDIRAPNAQQEYESRGAVNTVLLHPNQGELITGALVSPLKPLPARSQCQDPQAFLVCLDLMLFAL